ncbi:hypothetical protein BC829DRAFT_412764 [Chytridium lagenaria]|nr:hypothetical protein BC829DRAFT_412764 [Chytridium lagenaria]
MPRNTRRMLSKALRPCVPENWPEVADYECELADVREVVGRALVEGGGKVGGRGGGEWLTEAVEGLRSSEGECTSPVAFLVFIHVVLLSSPTSTSSHRRDEHSRRCLEADLGHRLGWALEEGVWLNFKYGVLKLGMGKRRFDHAHGVFSVLRMTEDSRSEESKQDRKEKEEKKKKKKRRKKKIGVIHQLTRVLIINNPLDVDSF